MNWQKWAVVLLLVIAAVQGYWAIVIRQNDFAVHRAQGAGFLKGKPYAHGLDTYPVARTMLNGAFAAMPNEVARGVSYGLAILALWGIYWMWSRMADGIDAAGADVNRAAGIVVGYLYLLYLLRDLDECGLQIFLLFFLTAAAYALWRQKPGQTGFWIATAIQYKVAPLLFLPFLVWKRQWRATICTMAFVVYWAVVPALFIGWDATWEGHQTWFARVAKVNSARDAYPSLQEMEPPKPQNQSLMAGLARYLETYPANHPLHFDHPWFAQFGNLDKEHAYLAVRGILLGLGLVLAWRWRSAWQGSALASNLPGEWAAVTMLASLLAPQCWKQHLVVVLPAAFLVTRQQLAASPWMRWRLGALGGIAAVLGLSRQQIVGQELADVLMMYKLDTIGSLVLLAFTLILPRAKKLGLPASLPNPLRKAA